MSRNVAVASMTAALVAAGAAVAGEVPLPRQRPKAIAAKAKSSQPKVRRPAIRWRKPRPRPAGLGQATPATPKTAVVTTDASGRVEVVVPRLGRERNPDVAAELQPKEVTHWSKAEITAAARRCDLVLAATNVVGERLKPIGGPGGCGIAQPIRVSALGAVKVNPPATLNCTLAAALYNWVTDAVQPAARDSFKQPVVAIRNASAYSCRRRNNASTGRISEHAFGNALDIASFTLAGGDKITILGDWSNGIGSFFGVDRKGAFLTKARKGACQLFSTVLSPEYNKAHRNHFHVDLGRDGRYKICK